MPDIWALMREIRRSALSAPEKHVLLTLTSLIDPATGLIPERFQPSLTDLQKFTGLGRSTIARSLNSTEQMGWVKRTVPTKYASQKNKEKTSYLLSIPASESDDDPDRASATVALVPERDQLEGWSQGGTSATVGLGLVPGWDQASATVGLKELNHVNQGEPPPPTEEEPREATDLFGNPVESKPKKAPPAPAKRQRMSRDITKTNQPLPDDWHVSDEMKAWAKKTTPKVIVSLATEKFLSHFGDGVDKKKDWDKAWRNWLLRDQERAEESVGNAGRGRAASSNYQGRRGSSQHVPYRDPEDISRYKTSKI